MADILSIKSQDGKYLFPETLVTDLINKVQGKSSLAMLSQQKPMPFNGLKEFTFTLDKDIDIVAENAPKGVGGITIEPVVTRPLKVEYGARISDEFMYASEEARVEILRSFNEGFARKLSRGFDLMGMHGINPRTGTASEVIGTNHFDAKVDQTVTMEDDPEAAIEGAVSLVRGANGVITGMAMAPTLSGKLAGLKVNGVKQYPELAWGANPGSINGLKVDVNSTVSEVGPDDVAILGDFETMFRWGYAKQAFFELIRYGDPDNTGKDLRGHNQIYLRAEAYIGWGILEPKSFARITAAVETDEVSETIETGETVETGEMNEI